MINTIVAIGGGENGRFLEDGTQTLYETETIDEEIIKLTGKEHPNYLFIAHAMCFSKEIQDSYYETMKKIYKDKYGCNCKHLSSLELFNKEKVEELVEWADIIYEGGGDTLSLIKLWRESGFDSILKKAWKSGKVICGISAGAVCWFNSCNSDTNDNKFEIVECLNWIDIFMTPHCDEVGRRESTMEQLRINNKIGIMLSNCSAIEIVDKQFRIITSQGNVRNSKEGYAIKCYWKNGKYFEQKIETNKYFPLNNLILLDEKYES